MRIIGASLDSNRFTLVETFRDGSVISRLANTARMRPFTLRPPSDSAEFAASLTTDDFAQEIASWETARIHQRAPKMRFALGTNKELLRRHEAELADENDAAHETYIDKLVSFHFLPIENIYQYEVKWLGCPRAYNLWHDEKEIPPSFVDKFWKELSTTNTTAFDAYTKWRQDNPRKRTRSPKKPLSVITAGDNPPVFLPTDPEVTDTPSSDPGFVIELPAPPNSSCSSPSRPVPPPPPLRRSQRRRT